MYSISAYGAMIDDTARIDAIVRALRRVVTPESVVVDIGTGTGILALLACQLGARRVYAIEPDDAIEVARTTAAANGYADRIECIQALSTAATLPERADVVVSDIGGVLPWLKQHLLTIIDARARLLAPGGALIPCRDTLWMALVDSPELYRGSSEPWDRRPYGLDLTSARWLAINAWRQVTINESQLLTPATRVMSIDYNTVAGADLNVTAEWTISRGGTAYGFAAGIDRILVDGVGFSNAPDCVDRLPAGSIYRPGFFPWPSPVPLTPGDVVTIQLGAVLVGEDYVWRWQSEVRNAASAEVKARFDQSTFHGIPLTADRLRRRSASHVPSLNEEGRATSLTLDLMQQPLPLKEIAERLLQEFPSRFSDRPRALAFVSDLSERYSR
jgi:ribosomal protein L11 methyltransferase PrmA